MSSFELGKEKEARAAWEEAERADPTLAEAVYNLGLLRWRAAEIADDGLLNRLEEAHHGARLIRAGHRSLLAQVHVDTR